MLLLLIVSVIWAFSFGLVKYHLAGVDATMVAALRLWAALIVFLPFLRAAKLGAGRILRLALIGAVQFGIVYLLYLHSYAHLKGYEVALFTITTPLFVALLDAILEKRVNGYHVLAAVLSVVAAGVVVWSAPPGSGIGQGFLLIQASNVCFAVGQIAWRRERARMPKEIGDASVFAILYAGALVLTLVYLFALGDPKPLHLTNDQIGVIIYLGMIASGLGFFLWNKGASQVNAGTLAAFNNAKIPLGITVSLLFFGETANPTRLLISGGLMALAVWVAERKKAA